MPQVEVCLLPEEASKFDLQQKTVVVTDIFRASSTITAAMANGAKEIIPVQTLEECLNFKDTCILAAERNGEKPEGFSMGNSPLSYTPEKIKGKSLAFTTTNGTRAIAASQTADTILIGSFLNLKSIKEYILHHPQDIVIMCSGWKGQFSLEDSLYAGALAYELDFDIEQDTAFALKELYSSVKDNIEAFLKNSSHYRRLSKLNVKEDMSFCCTLNKFDVVPVVIDDKIITFS